MQKMMVLTHHKCATSWSCAVLRAVCEAAKIPLQIINQRQLIASPGCVVYGSNASYRGLPREDFRGLHIFRDVRDLLVSSYYSHLHSHPTEGWPELAQLRRKLQQTSVDEGLWLDLEFIESSSFHGNLEGPLKALQEWNYDDPRIVSIRMEDMVVAPAEVFQLKVLAKINLPAVSNLKQILRNHSFEQLAGRPRGQVNNQHHFRRGVPGGWREVLPQPLARHLTEKYGRFLVRHGYHSPVSGL